MEGTMQGMYLRRALGGDGRPMCVPYHAYEMWQVRSPKVYVRDSGLLHRLLGIADRHDLLSHPKVGASWEGFVIEQILMLDVRDPWFWGTHTGAELDLIVDLDGERVGAEVKRTDRPG